MDWRWSTFWDLMWNILVHISVLDWIALAEDGVALITWWASFWENLATRFDDIREWVKGRVTYLEDYAYDLYLQAMEIIDLNKLLMEDRIASISHTFASNMSILWSLLPDWVEQLYIDTQTLFQGFLDSALGFIMPHIMELRHWVYNLFSWINDHITIITEWLPSIREVVDWLFFPAYDKLNSFLTDPYGFVVGELGVTLSDVTTLWGAWAEPIKDFIVQDLPPLRNLLATGFLFLQTLVNDPLDTILTLLTPVFLDWLENLLAENW